MDAFLDYAEVREVLARGPTRSTVRLASGLQVDLRVVAPASYGAALMYFTGSKAHNIALRSLAAKRGWKLSEYGLFEGRKRLAGRMEDDVYRRLGLSTSRPAPREWRRDRSRARGHAAAARRASTTSAAACTPYERPMAPVRSGDGARAEELSYDYLAITDHGTCASQTASIESGSRAATRDRSAQRSSASSRFSSPPVGILDDGSLICPTELA
jgi:DNA polymerase (family 10)